ncbi:MAG: phosphoribosylaminoimidazolesuccinocarboxamide synthase [Patescibacteria group bacterium]
MGVMRGERIAKGKTKTIFEDLRTPEVVIIDSNDDITAGDGERRLTIPGKGRYSTQTAAHCFHTLRRHEIPNHFIEVVGPKSFRAHRAKMIPVEIVMRRRATGSYLLRNPSIPEGTYFDDLVVEFFFKDDKAHDPLMICDPAGNQILLFHSQEPINPRFTQALSPVEIFHTPLFIPILESMRDYAIRTFYAVEGRWRQLDVELIDLKIECGYTVTGNLIVADVITNDEWRIWPGGDKSRDRSKQVFRNAKVITPEIIEKIRSNYEWVGRETAKFLE